MQKTLRTFCLYRVSLSKQVDHVTQNGESIADIPMQKTACRQFCTEHGWTITAEFQEPGISGFKNSTFKRKAIKEIIAAAHKQAFDVLLVYTIDRLSRRDSDLPFLFSEITKCGISVWSVEEGELRYQTATDRLLVYLQGWKANGESERIGQRISTIQSQMVARGEYRGGPVPFGYKLIPNGKTSKQGRKQHSLAINENEAAVVRIIFDKLARENYSMYELTRFLSSLEPTPNVRKMTWRSTTLHTLVRNPIYIGCLRFKDMTSLPYEHLQIIDPEIFQLVQKKTRNKHKGKHSMHSIVAPPPNYHDIIICGHCGSHLVYNHAFRVLSDGSTSIQYLYRCYNKERFSEPCDGACTYSARRIDLDVHQHLELLMTMLLSFDEAAMIGTAVELARTEYLAQHDTLEKQLSELDAQIATIQKSIADSLRLYGISSTTQLQLLYSDVKFKREKTHAALQQLDPAQYELHILAKQKQLELIKLKEKCLIWRKGCWSSFESIITEFFDKISVYKGYDIKYKIVPKIQQFLSSDQSNAPEKLSSHTIPELPEKPS